MDTSIVIGRYQNVLKLLYTWYHGQLELDGPFSWENFRNTGFGTFPVDPQLLPMAKAPISESPLIPVDGNGVIGASNDHVIAQAIIPDLPSLVEPVQDHPDATAIVTNPPRPTQDMSSVLIVLLIRKFVSLLSLHLKTDVPH